MPNRWAAGKCPGPCCKKCTFCLQAVNPFTGLPYPTATIGGLTYALPDDRVCVTESGSPLAAAGGFFTGASAPDNPLNGVTVGAPPISLASYGIVVRVLSAIGSGGADCGVESTPCPCDNSLPLPTITMSVNDATKNFGTLQPSALTWGPTPAWASILSISPYAFISPGTFTDTLAPDSPFYYVLICYLGTYGVLRIFEASPYGSPFRDVFRYQWVPGVVGNSCDPFLMAAGSIYPGGDPTQIVTLSG